MSTSGSSEFLAILKGEQRFVVVSEKELDFSSQDENRVFILLVEGLSEGGGRIGAIGSRSVSAVMEFILKNGTATKLLHLEGERAKSFEVPFFVTRIPLSLPDGSQSVVYGAVDKETVLNYERNAHTS